MKEVYITKIKKKNAFFKIYLTNGKYNTKGAEKNYQLKLELENIISELDSTRDNKQEVSKGFYEIQNKAINQEEILTYQF